MNDVRVEKVEFRKNVRNIIIANRTFAGINLILSFCLLLSRGEGGDEASIIVVTDA